MKWQRFNTKKGGLALPSRRMFGASMAVATLAVIVGVGTYNVLVPQNPALAAGAPTDFVTTWNTDPSGETNDSTVRFVAGGVDDATYNYEIDWGNDGEFDQTVTTAGEVSHDYEAPGVYTIRIRGDIPKLQAEHPMFDRNKLISVDQWGAVQWRSMNSSFAGLENLEVNATDVPNLSQVTDMSYMFYGSPKVNANFSNWNTSTITNMSNLFNGAVSFNGDISGWNTSNVTDMTSMFESAREFNQPLNNWDVSSVESMYKMFSQAVVFNQDLGEWDTSNVTNMQSLFNLAPAFNGDISTWDTSNVTDMSYMFAGAESFNKPIGSWDTSNVTDMRYILQGARSFNSSLNSWNVSKLTSLQGMFAGASAFNRPLDSWDTSNVTFVDATFYHASSFNQNLASWNLSKVWSGADMFSDTAMLPSNFDAMLEAWALQPLKSDVSLDTVDYCEAGEARQYIIDTFNWRISGTKVCEALRFSAGDSLVFDSSEIEKGQLVGEFNAYGFTPVNYAFCDGEISSYRLEGNQLIFNDYNTSWSHAMQVCVRATDSEGLAAERTVTIAINVTGEPEEPTPVEAIISGVTFDKYGNENALNVHGEGLIHPEHGQGEAYERSLVSLNGDPLPFCSDHVFGFTAAQIADKLGLGEDQTIVSDERPCYLLMDTEKEEGLFTENLVRIILPTGFDISAEGIVAVRESDPYTFNSNNTGEPHTAYPTVGIGGVGSLENTPTITKRPTFNGKAEPGAQVTVTVHSDPISCSATANANGNWSCTLPSDLAPGNHTVFVRVMNPDGSVIELGPYSVRVAGGQTANGGAVVNNTTPLAPNTGAGMIEKLRAYKDEKQRQQYFMIASVAGLGVVLIGTSWIVLSRKRRHAPAFVRR